MNRFKSAAMIALVLSMIAIGVVRAGLIVRGGSAPWMTWAMAAATPLSLVAGSAAGTLLSLRA